MRKVLEGRGDIPAEKRPMMEQHMGIMQKHWQQIHDQCCMMHLGNCLGMARPTASDAGAACSAVGATFY